MQHLPLVDRSVLRISFVRGRIFIKPTFEAEKGKPSSSGNVRMVFSIVIEHLSLHSDVTQFLGLSLFSIVGSENTTFTYFVTNTNATIHEHIHVLNRYPSGVISRQYHWTVKSPLLYKMSVSLEKSRRLPSISSVRKFCFFSKLFPP